MVKDINLRRDQGRHRSEEERLISLVYTRRRGVVSIGETNVNVSVYVLHVILSDVPVPIGGGFEAGHPDGMHAIVSSGFDVVKVLPLHGFDSEQRVCCRDDPLWLPIS